MNPLRVPGVILAALLAFVPETYSTGPTTLRDRDGNVIANNPEAYNVDSARK
jgi:hypothetical protein